MMNIRIPTGTERGTSTAMQIHLEIDDVAMPDGTSSKITCFRSGRGSAVPVVIIMPAMGVKATFYDPLALALCGAGVHAVTADLRGLGHSSVRVHRGIDFGYHEMLDVDWPATVAAVRHLLPESPMFLMGHSLGGQISALYAGLHPDRIAGLVLAASCTVYYRGWPFPKSLGILWGTRAAQWISLLLGYFPGKSLGFGGTAAKGVIRDWAANARTGRYDLANSERDIDDMLGQAQIPVLAMSFSGDQFAPVPAVNNLLGKMHRASVTHRHYAPEDLDASSLNHFSWVQASEALAPRIVSWIESRQAR